jgi:cytoskeletal protein RodZ
MCYLLSVRMPKYDMIHEGESKDARDKFMKDAMRAEVRRRYFNPFVLSAMIFFSILVSFVVMMMIVILVFLNKGFSNIHLLLG